MGGPEVTREESGLAVKATAVELPADGNLAGKVKGRIIAVTAYGPDGRRERLTARLSAEGHLDLPRAVNSSCCPSGRA